MTDDDSAARDDDARDLLAAYALDAVDDVERRAVERLAERDAGAARELAGLRATAAALGAAAAAPPPPALRDAVLAQVRRTPQVGSAPSAAERRSPWAPLGAPTGASEAGPSARTGRPDGRRPRRATTWLAVAATVAGAAVVPSVLAVREAQRAAQAEQQALAVADLLAEPGARVVRADVAGGGTAVGVLADDRALFTGVDLPDPGQGRDYQLWVVRDGAALSAGVLEREEGRATGLTQEYRTGDALAVTVEPAGGSAQPTSEPVVVLAG